MPPLAFLSRYKSRLSLRRREVGCSGFELSKSGVVADAAEPGGASARAFFLLGMIRQAAGDRDGAEAFFLKAVYLDGQDDEALLALALLARRRGDVATESVYRRRAERVRSRKGAP